MKIIYDKNRREVVTAYSGDVSQLHHVQINNKNPKREYIEVTMEDNMEFLTNLKRYDIYLNSGEYSIYEKPKGELISDKDTIKSDGLDTVKVNINITKKYLIPEPLLDWYNVKNIYINGIEYVLQDDYIEITSDEPNTIIKIELAKGMYYTSPIFIEVV